MTVVFRSAIATLAKAKTVEEEIKAEFLGFTATGRRFKWDGENKRGTNDWILNEGRSQPETRQEAKATYKKKYAWRNPAQG